jgi:hypothetical protein
MPPEPLPPPVAPEPLPEPEPVPPLPEPDPLSPLPVPPVPPLFEPLPLSPPLPSSTGVVGAWLPTLATRSPPELSQAESESVPTDASKMLQNNFACFETIATSTDSDRVKVRDVSTFQRIHFRIR